MAFPAKADAWWIMPANGGCAVNSAFSADLQNRSGKKLSFYCSRFNKTDMSFLKAWLGDENGENDDRDDERHIHGWH